jgi:hypothetical protein
MRKSSVLPFAVGAFLRDTQYYEKWHHSTEWEKKIAIQNGILERKTIEN